VRINNIVGSGESYLAEAVLLSNLKEANSELEGERCVVAGLARGFLLLKCGSGAIGIPYELIRDRAVSIKEHRPS
ncbi:MAG: hypothetical protein J7L55_04985, partial [Desulfurococcales archaeon]|nr:hypothetical protein [Desulfurococcales archaeon]